MSTLMNLPWLWTKNSSFPSWRQRVAVLSFQFVSRGSEGSLKWNATEVYRKLPEGWRIIHTHWSYAQPKLGGVH